MRPRRWDQQTHVTRRCLDSRGHLKQVGHVTMVTQAIGTQVNGQFLVAVLDPRDGRLASEVAVVDIAAGNDLEDGITSQRVMVFLVFIASDDAEDSLPHDAQQGLDQTGRRGFRWRSFRSV